MHRCIRDPLFEVREQRSCIVDRDTDWGRSLRAGDLDGLGWVLDDEALPCGPFVETADRRELPPP
jgi:hypothetical protein